MLMLFTLLANEKNSQFDLVADRSDGLRMQEDIINGVLGLGETDTSLP